MTRKELSPALNLSEARCWKSANKLARCGVDLMLNYCTSNTRFLPYYIFIIIHVRGTYTVHPLIVLDHHLASA